MTLSFENNYLAKEWEGPAAGKSDAVTSAVLSPNKAYWLIARTGRVATFLKGGVDTRSFAANVFMGLLIKSDAADADAKTVANWIKDIYESMPKERRDMAKELEIFTQESLLGDEAEIEEEAVTDVPKTKQKVLEPLL